MNFTRHARNRMRQHSLGDAEVESLVWASAERGTASDGKPIVFGVVRGQRYRVVYVVEDGNTTVISVHPRRTTQ